MHAPPPEPMVNPSKDWVDMYAAWYENEPTASARWREQEEVDPHNNRYDCERHELFGGQLTDDELANAQYLCDGQIIKQDMVKDRIRWLSRQLEKAKATIAQLTDEK